MAGTEEALITLITSAFIDSIAGRRMLVKRSSSVTDSVGPAANATVSVPALKGRNAGV
jgi:hypothetical protein